MWAAGGYGMKGGRGVACLSGVWWAALRWAALALRGAPAPTRQQRRQCCPRTALPCTLHTAYCTAATPQLLCCFCPGSDGGGGGSGPSAGWAPREGSHMRQAAAGDTGRVPLPLLTHPRPNTQVFPNTHASPPYAHTHTRRHVRPLPLAARRLPSQDA